MLNKPLEERHLEQKFVNAPAIFPNNDIKFDVNKTRAQIFAESVNESITWCIARDTPTNKVIADKPNLESEKKVWLTRHDRDCGGLYGVLPLVPNLPVMLTERYDRNPEKQLLKGRIGYIHSWQLDERETSVFEGNARYLRYPPKVVSSFMK